MNTLDFWYDFASTYSYPAALRVEDVAREKGVAVRWRPFLLGPIFARQGWTTSPFNLFPAKGKNMIRDLERLCAKLRLPFVSPDPFPQNSLLAARVAWALEEDARGPFSRAVYLSEFGEGRRIDDPDSMSALLAACGHEPRVVLERAGSDEVKSRLKAQGADVERHGIYGAPSFVTASGELFWGNDRLEDAVEWAASGR